VATQGLALWSDAVERRDFTLLLQGLTLQHIDDVIKG